MIERMMRCLKCQEWTTGSAFCWACDPARQAAVQSDAKEMSVLDEADSGIITGLSPDAPTITTANGGRHSYTGVDFTQLDPECMFEDAATMYQGEQKYGRDNWKGITAEEHVNHAIMHLYGWLKGDRSDKHLGHARIRAMMAQVVDRDGVTTQ